MKSNYSRQRSFSTFKQDFTSNTRNGLDLIDLKIDNGYFFAAYGNNIGKADTFVSRTTGYVARNISDLKAEILDKKADGYELTDLEFGDDGYWHSIYATGEGDSKLIEANTYAGIREQLLDLQDLNSSFSRDYQIADIEYANGKWLAVADYALGDAAYVSSDSFRDFEAEVARQRRAGLELNNLEYVSGDFIGIYSEDISGVSDYSSRFHRDIDDFTAEIEAYRDRGFHLINTETINGSWFGIYKQDAEFGKPLTSASGREPVFDPAQDVLSKITPTFGLIP